MWSAHVVMGLGWEKKKRIKLILRRCQNIRKDGFDVTPEEVCFTANWEPGTVRFGSYTSFDCCFEGGDAREKEINRDWCSAIDAREKKNF